MHYPVHREEAVGKPLLWCVPEYITASALRLKLRSLIRINPKSNHINSFIHTPEHICGVASKYVHMRIEAKQTYIPDGHAYSKIVSLGNVAYELCLFFNREVFK